MKALSDILDRLQERIESISVADAFSRHIIEQVRESEELHEASETIVANILASLSGQRSEAAIFALATSLGYSAHLMNGHTSVQHVDTGEKRDLSSTDYLTSFFIIADLMLRLQAEEPSKGTVQ